MCEFGCCPFLRGPVSLVPRMVFAVEPGPPECCFEVPYFSGGLKRDPNI